MDLKADQQIPWLRLRWDGSGPEDTGDFLSDESGLFGTYMLDQLRSNEIYPSVVYLLD